MTKKEKETEILEIKELLNNATSLYLADFTGLTVEETNEFRNELFKAKVVYRVIKNTLVKKALNGNGGTKFSGHSDILAEHLKGPTGVIFVYDDPVSPAKIIKKYFDKGEKPKLKIALIENVAYDSTKLNLLAALLTKPEIVSSIISSLQSPVSGIVNTVNAVIRDLASVIEEVAKSKSNK